MRDIAPISQYMTLKDREKAEEEGKCISDDEDEVSVMKN